MMTIIYVLKCQEDKYYVGKTNHSAEERFQEHLNNPCAWTRKYPPTDIIHSFESRFEFDEDMTTMEYMKTYGIDNVRGGTYTQVILPKHQYQTLRNQITHVGDKCFRCNQHGHFAKQCQAILNYKTTNNYEIKIKPVRKIGGKMEGKWMCLIKQDNNLKKTLYSSPNDMDVLNTCAKYLNINVTDIYEDKEDIIECNCWEFLTSCFRKRRDSLEYIELDETI
jgi:predicted GIY-YIG superfamily endonuclease/Txe/YoeB family toxin of Txe-Axe toxin-antitoxin module